MGLSQGGSSGGGGGGEANTSSNVGTGAQLAKAKVGVDLPFRTIKGGANVSVVQNADEVEISSTGGGGGGGEANTTSNAGTGEGTLAKAKVGVDLPIKSIKAGANIGVTNNADDVTLAVTGTIPAGNQAAQTMAGDVTGTTAASVVAKVNGATIPAAGALTTGNVPQVSGASAMTYGPINLAGGANHITGVLPASNVASPSGTGVAKVSASAWVSAASLIVNNDIDAAAAIHVSKLSIGSAGHVIRNDGSVVSWGQITNLSVSDTAAISWSKFGGNVQEVKPTGFNFTGLARGRPYQRGFYDTLSPVAGSPYSRARQYSFTLPDNATTAVTVSATTFNSSSTAEGRNSNAVYKAVFRRVGGTVTKEWETNLIAAEGLDVESSNSGSTCVAVVKDAAAGSPGSDTVAHVRIELDCSSSVDLPASVTITSAETPG